MTSNELPTIVVKGVLARKFHLRMVGRDGKWPVRDFVLDLDGGRQKRLMQGVRSALETLDAIREGDMIECEFVMKGREIPGADGRGGYFNLDEVFKIRTV